MVNPSASFTISVTALTCLLPPYMGAPGNCAAYVRREEDEKEAMLVGRRDLQIPGGG